MNTHESYVSLEIAKLLKQAGFDWECREYYYNFTTTGWSLSFDDDFVNWNSWSEQYISAPTLAVAQRWLREVKRCIVEVNYDDCQKHYWVELFINEDDGGGIPFYGNVFTMFEEAQEAGINKCLTILLKED